MSRKIILISILLISMFLGGCVSIQTVKEVGKDGKVRETTTYSVNVPVNVNAGMSHNGVSFGNHMNNSRNFVHPGNIYTNRGDGFVDVHGPNGFRGSYDTRYAK